MTVQELITDLEKCPDKSVEVEVWTIEGAFAIEAVTLRTKLVVLDTD